MLRHLLGVVACSVSLGASVIKTIPSYDFPKFTYQYDDYEVITFEESISYTGSIGVGAKKLINFYYEYNPNEHTFFIPRDYSVVDFPSLVFNDQISNYKNIAYYHSTQSAREICFSLAYVESAYGVIDYCQLTIWFGNYFIGGYITPYIQDLDFDSYTPSSVNLDNFNTLFDSSSFIYNRCYIKGDSAYGGGHYGYNGVDYAFRFDYDNNHNILIDISFDITFEYSESNIFIINEWNRGYMQGYNDAKNIFYDKGYNDGYADGDTAGYNRGYEVGYNASQPLTMNFLSLIGAIADTPVLVIRNLYSFDLFGASALTIFMSILTAIIVIHFIRKFF